MARLALPAVRSLSGVRRVATMSVHTSPLDQPGAGDAGGMNVYVVELSRRLAALGIEVDIFTRATTSALPPVVELAPGVTVRHITAGPYEGLRKNDLPAQLCAFTSGVLRTEAGHDPGHYDLVHSHYWLSGQVGWLAAERWGVPLVHTFHTLARVKNAALADGDEAEPDARVIGESQVVAAATRLIASTEEESDQLVGLYDADPAQVATIPPGVDVERFRPGPRGSALGALGLPPDALLLLFVGRIQPLKAPDVLVRAAADLVGRLPALRPRLVVGIVGGPSGTGADERHDVVSLARRLGVADLVRFVAPVTQERLVQYYRAAHAVVVPSHSESFGLVALEAQACATPVVAAAVGGLRTAVRHGETGLLVSGHDPRDYSAALESLLTTPALRDRLGTAGVSHAAGFSWAATAHGVLDVYRDAVAAHGTRRTTAQAGA